MNKVFLTFWAMIIMAISAKAQQTSDQWENLYGKKLFLKEYCEGENDPYDKTNIRRAGNVKECERLEFIVLYEDGILQWRKGHNFNEYRVEVDGSSADVTKVYEGDDDVKWFQILSREDEKVTIWSNDSYIRYFEIGNGHHHDDDDDHHHDHHHHDGDHHHHDHDHDYHHHH